MIGRVTRRRVVLATLAAAILSCAGDQVTDHSTASSASAFPGIGAPKADVFGRQLIGVASPYQADLTLQAQEQRLVSDMAYRRQVGWEIFARTVDSVPLLGLSEAADEHAEIELPNGVPTVPRWQTWYGVDDFKRMFSKLYSELSAEERAQRVPFSDEALATVFDWNASALERSERWPLGRFFKHVSALGVCPTSYDDAECAMSLQSKFSGAAAGNSRITYSPATMMHLLKNYSAILNCIESLDQVSFAQPPANPDSNFSYCFEEEFPANAVLTKAHWQRADFGRTVPVFDTNEKTLETILNPNNSADWANGDRQANPSADKIYTIALKNGDTYRLTGLHIMTKELRHWVWVTLWWSDQPNLDFGADRPATLGDKVASVWNNYKMGVVVDYKEKSPDVTKGFEHLPSLAAALRVTSGELTWLSNPYIEHGRGNARTNCIGCHQHGGSTVGPDLNSDGILDPFDLEMVIEIDSLFPSNGRTLMRTMFPTDYLWSTQRVDDLNQLIRAQVEHFDYVEKNLPEVRTIKVLALKGDAESGSDAFLKNCTACHGNDGSGTNSGPSLFVRVPGLTDRALVQTLITGKDLMPSWAHLQDQDLANIRAYLRPTFSQ